MGWKVWVGLIFLLWLLPGAAWARFEVGGGMEYYSVQTYLRDPQGNYFQTLLKSTLGRLRVGYSDGPLSVAASTGYSDWQVSGGIHANDLPAVSLDAFYAAWQVDWDAEAAYAFADGWGAGVAYDDHALRQYRADGFVLLNYRTRALGLFLRYAPLRAAAVTIALTAGYDPFVQLDLSQTTEIYQDQPLDTIRDYDAAGTGTRWYGQARLQYRDSAGWGIDILYSAGFARFPEMQGLEEASLRYGTLTGYFTILF